jgi:hypothetical protein
MPSLYSVKLNDVPNSVSLKREFSPYGAPLSAPQIFAKLSNSNKTQAYIEGMGRDRGHETRGNTCGTVGANRTAASLMKLIKTPPPSLLRARFATVLGHLPSVPSVVLPIMSLVDTDRAHLLLKPINKRREIKDSLIHSI